MASPSVNWDEFGNQALLVQELLSNPEDADLSSNFSSKLMEPEDSPLFISKVAEPCCLVMLSPDMLLGTVEKMKSITYSPLKKVNENSGHKQKDAAFRTPLKDCTNVGQKDIKIMNDTIIITPVKSIHSEEHSSCLCPSSAEFRDFLTGIMDVSVVDKDGSFEVVDGESVDKCSSPVVVDEPVEDTPVRKGRARRGTYDLVSPSCDLSGLCAPETISSIEVVDHFTNSSSDLLMSDMSTDAEATKFVPDGNYDGLQVPKEENRLETCINDVDNSTQMQKDNMLEELLVEIGDDLSTGAVKPCKRQLSKMSNLMQPKSSLAIARNKGFDGADKNLAKIGADLVSCLETESVHHGNVELVVLETTNLENGKVIPNKDDNLQEKDKQAVVNENVGQQFTREEKGQGFALKMVDVHPVSCLQKKSASGVNVELVVLETTNLENRKVLPNKEDSLQEKGKQVDVNENIGHRFSREDKRQRLALKMVDVDPVSCLQKKSACDINVESIVSEITNLENSESVSVSKGNRSQEKDEQEFVIVSGNTSESAKTESEATNMNMHVSSPEDNCTENQKILDTIPKKAPILNKNVSASCLPCKPSTKGDTSTSSVVPKKAPLTRLPLMKPGQIQSKLSLRRPSTGLASSKSQIGLLTAAIDCEAKESDAITLPKVVVKQQCGESNLANREALGEVKLIHKPSLRLPSKTSGQSQGPLQAQLYPDKLRMKTKGLEQDAGNVNTTQPQDRQQINVLKKPGISKLATLKLTRKPALTKDVQTASAAVKDVSCVNKSPLPVMDASRTVSKGAVKGIALSDASRTVTKKISPVKVLFPVKDSRTVTIEDQPIMSRTITKEAAPAGCKTVTKGFCGLSSDTSRNQAGTPLIGDRLLVPKRLSNVFHTPSALSSGNVSDNDKRHHSFIPTPTRFSRTSSNSSQGSMTSDSSFRKASFASPIPGKRVDS